MSSMSVLLPGRVDPLFIKQIAKTLAVQVIIKPTDQIVFVENEIYFPVRVDGDDENIKAFEGIATTTLMSFNDYLRLQIVGASLPDVEALEIIKRGDA